MPVALLAFSAWAYRASPERMLLDSKFALLTCEALLSRGSFDLLPYFPGLAARIDAADFAGDEDPDFASKSSGNPGVPYQLRLVEDGRLVYHYPMGSSLLSLPLFAVQKLLGGSTLDPSGKYSMRGELRLQAELAALLAGAAVGLAFFLARREVAPGAAAIVALGAAFGSGLWSVASRTLWTHTWTIVLLAAALLELLRWEDGEKRRPVLLGALLVAAFWVRPTNAFSAAAFALVVALRHRAALPRLLATGTLGFALYVALSRIAFATWLPGYLRHVVPHGKARPLEAFLGQLLSAEHGLLVFSPVLLLAAWQLVRCGFAPERRAVAALALGLVGWYVVYHCWRARWWGTGAVGPRFLADVIPYLVWLGAHAWRRARERPFRTAAARWAVRAATALLLLAGAAAHAKGAFPVRPGEVAGVPRGVRREQIAPLGTRAYFAKLPQPQTVQWIVRSFSSGGG